MEPTPTPAPSPAPAPSPPPALEGGGKLAAVLIGIDEYKAFGIPNLAGARNDICAWWRMLVERLGAQGADITVLHGGRLTPDELAGPRRVGETPQAHALRVDAAQQTSFVEATAERAGQAIQTARRGLGADARLLIVFSGHGTADPSLASLSSGSAPPLDKLGLVFPEAVPDNGTVLPGATGTLPLPALRGALAAATSGGLREENVTVVVDACFGRPALGAVHWGRTVGLQTLPDLALGPALNGPGVTIHSCGTEELATEVRLDGVVRGAFTAGLLFSTDQWSTGEQRGGGRYVRAKVGELVDRAARHVDLWGGSQSPVVGGKGASGRAFLHRKAAPASVGTSAEPDRRKDGRQIIVETLHGSGGYEFDDNTGKEVLRVAATGNLGKVEFKVGSLELESHQEYWRMLPSAAGRLEALVDESSSVDFSITRTTQVHKRGATWIPDKLLKGKPKLKRLRRKTGLNWKLVSSLDQTVQAELMSSSKKERRAVFHWQDIGSLLQGPYRRALQVRWNSSNELTALYFLTDEPVPGVSFFKHFVKHPGTALTARLVKGGTSLPTATHTWWVSMQPLKEV
jgi:hypothetical protein